MQCNAIKCNAMQCVRAHQCDHLVVIHIHPSPFLSLSLSLPLSRCLPSCLSPSTRARHAPATHHLTLSVSSVHQHTNGCKTVVLTRFAGGENAAACRSQSSSRAGSPLRLLILGYCLPSHRCRTRAGPNLSSMTAQPPLSRSTRRRCIILRL